MIDNELGDDGFGGLCWRVISITGGMFDWAGIMGGRACGIIQEHNVVMSHVDKLGTGAGIYVLKRGCGCWVLGYGWMNVSWCCKMLHCGWYWN